MSSLNLKQTAIKAFDAAGTKLLSPPMNGFGYFINHGPRNKRKVALTFDDGPSRPATEHLLEAMRKLDVKGTFFCLGVNVRYHPDLLLQMYQEGHVIGNHSGWHSRKTGLMLGSDIRHILDGEQAIAEVLGVRPCFYRPPWGWLTPWEGKRLTKAGYKVIGWDVYTLDWVIPEVDGITLARDAYRDTKPGSIYCFHDAKPWEKQWVKTETTRAIQALVPMLREQGYEFVTVAELLDVPAYAATREVST
ncbi:polysaccharide deacetylase [Oscillochloris trichoides DG-6]|uniref:Polysaccharide deacetylase n=1 Tax=Oscillochloris trichoides DG-6 TaxID=765420 RepID=E1I9L1_9CHLR|nr:polysaccharide deacetylase family protein [Oscillochloris trichoides]EFO82089.1 polysaccharide deacetylase [Oscillochloris trichoides DG-6]